MEEETTPARSATHRPSLPALLALSLFLVWLSACRAEPQNVVEDPTRLVVPASAVSTAVLPEQDANLPATSTPLPVISFMGVEFGYDEPTFGPLLTRALHPPTAGTSGPLQPKHLQFSMANSDGFDVPQLYIYAVDQYRALSPEAGRQIDYLTTLLRDQPLQPEGALPMLPMLDAMATFHTNPTYFDFRNGRGLSYVVRADHDHSLQTAETLYYTFQGLTDNGRFLVTAYFPLAEANLENGALQQLPVHTPDAEDAKPVSDAKWAGLPAGAGVPAVEEMLATLFIAPDDALPEAELPAFAHTPGVLLAYDPAINSEVSVAKVPAVVSDAMGSVEFLPGVADIVRYTFAVAPDQDGTLTIQPVRDSAGQLFSSIPAWQQNSLLDLEQQLAADGGPDRALVPFHTGQALRWLDEAANEIRVQGLTHDGRYLIDLTYPVTAAGETIAYVDRVIGSLVVEPEASTESSVPPDQDECVHDAEFIEDVTMPDYTAVERGDTFVKLWRVRNSGSCTWTPAYEIVYAQGNPVEWTALPVTSIVRPGEVSEVGITAVSPETPGTYQSWFQLASEENAAFGAQLLLLFEAPKPATDIPGYGVIEGSISYPAGNNPPLDIYFQRVDGSERYAMRTEKGWTQFANAIPVGSYHVFARVAGDESGSGGGYTQAVICGLHASCADHTLVTVVVEESKATSNADIFDWYAPSGSFPLP